MTADKKITWTKLTTVDGEQTLEMIADGEIVGFLSRERPYRRVIGLWGFARDMSQTYDYVVDVMDISISIEPGTSLRDVKKAMIAAFTA